MGRRRSNPETASPPPGLIARVRPSGTHYYLSRSEGGRRQEIPLGKLLEQALAEYEAIRPHRAKPITDPAATARELFVRCRKGAKQRGLEFALDVAEIELMLLESRSRCALTGIPFDLARPDGARKRLWAPSIDRVESSKGYVAGNVRVVAIGVNIAMSDFGEEFLIRIAHALLRRRHSTE